MNPALLLTIEKHTALLSTIIAILVVSLLMMGSAFVCLLIYFRTRCRLQKKSEDQEENKTFSCCSAFQFVRRSPESRTRFTASHEEEEAVSLCSETLADTKHGHRIKAIMNPDKVNTKDKKDTPQIQTEGGVRPSNNSNVEKAAEDASKAIAGNAMQRPGAHNSGLPESSDRQQKPDAKAEQKMISAPHLSPLREEDSDQWSVEDVSRWLTEQGFAVHVKTFHHNTVDGIRLHGFNSESALYGLGMERGADGEDRHALLEKIEGLREKVRLKNQRQNGCKEDEKNTGITQTSDQSQPSAEKQRMPALGYETWTPVDVCQWLKEEGLGRHVEKFKRQKIDGRHILYSRDRLISWEHNLGNKMVGEIMGITDPNDKQEIFAKVDELKYRAKKEMQEKNKAKHV